MPDAFRAYTDMGGTFTDSFLVDSSGRVLTGKAATTPSEEEVGYLGSLEDAIAAQDADERSLGEALESVAFATTSVINTLITLGGSRVGVLTTKGFEQALIIGRGVQTWSYLPRRDRIHYVTHRRVPPLVAPDLILGVTERVDCFGEVVIPLRESEVDAALSALIERGAEAIVVSLLFSWANPVHEARIRQLVDERSDAVNVPLFMSSEVAPVMRELQRGNSVVVEAYAGKAFRRTVARISEGLTERNFGGTFDVMLSTGGVTPAANARAVETLASGPVGGLIGGREWGMRSGCPSVITTDMGGTSFDIGVITDGEVGIEREPWVEGRLLAVPMANVVSIGAGGGTLFRVEPGSRRLLVGPESAGASPGPACYGKGGTGATATDVDVVLGYIDPDFFLGGRLELQSGLAEKAVIEHIAEPLGLDLQPAAWMARRLLDLKMRDAIMAHLAVEGRSAANYTLLAFGGAGPTHVAGYAAGLGVQAVAIPPFPSVFSAFGAAMADYEHHYSHACNLRIPATDDGSYETIRAAINSIWDQLELRVTDQLSADGRNAAAAKLEFQAMVRFGGQLEDLVITSLAPRLNDPAALEGLLGVFRTDYVRRFGEGAVFTGSGYEIFELGLKATIPMPKPTLPRLAERGASEDPLQPRTMRSCWFDAGWINAAVFDYEALRASDTIEGPAIIEDAKTTIVVPPEVTVTMGDDMTIQLTGARERW